MQKTILFLSISLLLLSACSIEKRHYTKGFYFHKKPVINFSPEEKKEPVIIQEDKCIHPEEEQSLRVVFQDSLPLNETVKQPQNVSVDSRVLKNSETVLLKKEEISSLNHTSVVVPDSTHQNQVKQNKKNMAGSDELEEEFLGANTMFSLCLLFIAVFVFNPSLGMFWLAALLFGPMGVICSLFSLYCIAKAARGLLNKWYSPKENKTILWLLAWAVFNLLIAVLLTLMLIAMFA